MTVNDGSGERHAEVSSLTEHKLVGEISRVVFNNEENGYSVLRLIDQQGVEHTVVGEIPGAFEGQGVEVKGKWELHKEHGRQFRASEHRFVLPTTVEGIKRYLSSGVVQGIGPKIAECIVDAFGLRTLEIMDNHSARLLEVPGFGKKRLEMVRDAWKEQARRRDIFVFLQGLGVTNAYCLRIYKRYGDQAAEIVKEDPYRLADEVDGIGFILADRIASALGVGKIDDKRLASGVRFALSQINQNGHVCYPEREFVKQTAELLGVDETNVIGGLELAIERRQVAVEPGPRNSSYAGDRLVYDYRLWRTEIELAGRINAIASQPRHAGQRIRRSREASTINFSDEQLSGVDNVSRCAVSVITGGPGVGKTTVVGELVRGAVEARLKIYLAAPTGRAAKRLSESCGRKAMTIHRMLKWDPVEKKFVYGERSQLPCDLLIVDEVSMLDLSLALHLFRAVNVGTTVVFVGDVDQLPSVGPGNVLRDLIDSGCCPVTRLTKIYRQGEGSRIIPNAHAVNHGRMPDLRTPPKQLKTDFYWIEKEEPDDVIDLITKMVKERIPQRFGFHPTIDIQVLTPMNRGSCGTKILNETLQKALNSGHKPQFSIGERVFKSGDKVMQISNNYDKNVFNGDMGVIKHIDSGTKSFRVAFEGFQVVYEYEEAEQLTHAYAVTVHKAQGSEFPAVIVPVLTQHYVMLRRNLLYTAMTRAKKLLVLVGSRKAVSIAVGNFQVEPRHTLLLQRLRNEL